MQVVRDMKAIITNKDYTFSDDPLKSFFDCPNCKTTEITYEDESTKFKYCPMCGIELEFREIDRELTRK